VSHRVVHCGTGNIGTAALRAILQHPDLELVGHFVSTPDKVGRDSGELVGAAPTGVTATNEWAEVLDLQADCLTYFGNSIGREAEAIADLVPFLERGTNVVTFSGFEIAHPASAPAGLRDPIEAACCAGGSTCYFTGIDPGWATTDLAIASLATANRVDCIRVLELGWWGDYTAEFVCREYFGFGKEPGFQPLLVTGGFIEKMWAPTLYQLAEVLGAGVEELRVVYETDGLDHDVQTGFGTVAAGTASVVHFELQALSGGRPFGPRRARRLCGARCRQAMEATLRARRHVVPDRDRRRPKLHRGDELRQRRTSVERHARGQLCAGSVPGGAWLTGST
jgi:2,4-diaminopentanoate dehydrogenase